MFYNSLNGQAFHVSYVYNIDVYFDHGNMVCAEKIKSVITLFHTAVTEIMSAFYKILLFV